MICSKCGYESEQDFRFCPYCGEASVTEEAAQPTEETSQYIDYTRYSTEQTQQNSYDSYSTAPAQQNSYDSYSSAQPQQPYYQNGYTGQQNYNGNTAYQPQPSNGIAIAGFICSLLNISIIGLILSIIGYKKAKEMNGVQGSYKGLALAGIIISGVGIGAHIFTFIFYILMIFGYVASADMPSDIPGLEDVMENTIAILASKIL